MHQVPQAQTIMMNKKTLPNVNTESFRRQISIFSNNYNYDYDQLHYVIQQLLHERCNQNLKNLLKREILKNKISNLEKK